MPNMNQLQSTEIQSQLDTTSKLLEGKSQISPQEQQLQALISQIIDYWIVEFEETLYVHQGGLYGTQD
jgi:hypothetical protein